MIGDDKSFLTRLVNDRGHIWHKGRVFVSEVFRNEDMGLEQMEEDVCTGSSSTTPNWASLIALI